MIKCVGLKELNNSPVGFITEKMGNFSRMEYKAYKNYCLNHLGWKLSLFRKSTLKARRGKGMS